MGACGYLPEVLDASGISQSWETGLLLLPEDTLLPSAMIAGAGLEDWDQPEAPVRRQEKFLSPPFLMH